MLEKQKKKDNETSRRVEKPWGYELIWASTSQYVGKILVVHAGESLSLQFHKIKEETLYIESGQCKVLTGPSEDKLETLFLGPGSVLHLSPGTIHQITAETDCRIFEVSTNHLTDVVRLKDRYGRL